MVYISQLLRLYELLDNSVRYNFHMLEGIHKHVMIAIAPHMVAPNNHTIVGEISVRSFWLVHKDWLMYLLD